MIPARFSPADASSTLRNSAKANFGEQRVCSEKGVGLAQEMQAGPRIPVRIQL
jgi:hypothetical protein